jgi:hypothetical protein
MRRLPFRLLAAALAALASLASCTLLDMGPLAVTSWSPRDERLSSMNGVVIQIRFSRPVNIVLTEQAFSITADGEPLLGRVSWRDDSTLVFSPDEPLQEFVVYRMSVSGSAEDSQGRDLKPPFSHTFTTKTDSSRPTVVASSPADHSAILDLLSPISLAFSRRMDPATVYSAFSLSPPATGFFSISADGMVFTYTPTQQLQWQAHYTVTMSRSAADTQRNAIGSDFITHFSVGTDLNPPAVDTVQSSGHVLPADDPVNPLAMTQSWGWEATAGLLVTFSEPVLTSSALSAVTLSPSVAFTIKESNSLHTQTLTYAFPERLAYGATYTLVVAAGLLDAQGNKSSAPASYHFTVDGSATRPPVVTRLCFPSSAGDPATKTVLAAYDSIVLPSSTPPETFFDLYVTHASGALLEPFSVSQSFSVAASNGAADITPFAIEPNPAQVGTPAPGTDEEVIRVWVHVVNHLSSGQIVIRISTALTDEKGNGLAQEFVLPLNDVN